MRIITFILIFSFFSCNTQEKNENDSISLKNEIVIKDRISSNYKDSINTNNLKDQKTKNLLKQDSISSVEQPLNDQTFFCPKIKKRLKNVNWRRHSTDDCYVVDLEDEKSLGGFISEFYSLRKSCDMMTRKDIENLFGEPSEVSNVQNSLFLKYKIVLINSIASTKQQYCYLMLMKSDSSKYYEFSNARTCNVWAPDSPSH